MVACGAVTAVFQSTPVFASISSMTTRPGSVGSMFWTWLIALSASQALFNRRLSWAARAGLLSVTGLVIFHGVIQVRPWASGWVPALAAFAIIVLFRFPRTSVGAGLIGLPTLLLLSSFLTAEVMGDEQYSIVTRNEAWRVLTNVIERSPIIGTGPVNYYFYVENFTILGWHVKFFSHNQYEDLILQTGVVGILAFFWFAFEVGHLIVRLYPRVQDSFSRAYLVGALGGLVGSLVSGMLGDWIIPFYYNGGIIGFRSSLLFWVFLGGVIVIRRQAALATVPSRTPYALDVMLARSQRSVGEAH